MKVDQATGGVALPAKLEQEAVNLGKLRQLGIPTPEHGIVEWVDDKGVRRRGLLMDRIDGPTDFEALDEPAEYALTESGFVSFMDTGEFDPATLKSWPVPWNAVTEKTLADLERIRGAVQRNNIAIDEFQYLVSEADGSVRVIDVADGVHIGDPGKQDDVQYLLDTLDLQIKQVRSILANRPVR